MKPLDPSTYALVVAALRNHHVAKHAALEAGVSASCAWRIAKREKIVLLTLAEHHRKRLADPEFQKKRKPAARKAASAWLRQKHKDPVFHAKAIEAARVNLTRLNDDPAFRKASAARLKAQYLDPAFCAKQGTAARKAMIKHHRLKKSRSKRKKESC